jgi:hypothetical protein
MSNNTAVQSGSDARNDSVKGIPAGMVQVTKEAFWAQVMQSNVHPRPERFHTDWMNLRTMRPWGWESRGFCGPFDYQTDAPPAVYALAAVGA